MKIVLWLAKLIVLGFWVGAVYFTFIHPLPGKISTLIPAFAVLMLLVMGHLSMRLDARAQRRQQVLVNSLKEAQAALEEAAQHDPLTGLLNRQGFERMLH